MSALTDLHRRSLDDPDGFWLERAAAIDWTRAPTRALDDGAAPIYRWFPDGELNTSHNALDRHVAAGHGERAALVYDSPVTGTQRTFTYARAARPHRADGGRAARPRRRARRPRRPLHADGARGRHRDARLRTARRRPLGRLRRLRAARAGDPHRRRAAHGRPVGVVRDRGPEGHPVQAAARPRARARRSTRRTTA